MKFIHSIGHCSACGGMTSSGMFKLCETCSQTKNECQHCLTPLTAPAGPDQGSGASDSGK
jgi:hypothetical protein